MRRVMLPKVIAATAIILLAGANVSAKSINLQFWTVFGSKPHSEIIKQIIEKFEKENPGIKVTHIAPSSDAGAMFDKILVSLVSGSGPDVAWVAPERVSSLYGTAAITPVSQLEKIGGSIGLDDFYKGLTNPKNQYQRKMWGVPFENANLALVWNKAMFAKAGIAGPPKTWSEMTATAIKLTSKETRTFGYDSRYWDWYMEMWLAQKGVGLVNDNATKITWDSKPAIEATKWYTDLEVKYKAAAASNWASKKIGMGIYGNWEYQSIKASKIDFGVAPLPKADDGIAATRSTYKELCVFSRDKQKIAAAWKFIKYFMKDDVFMKWCVGTNYLPVKRSQAKTREYQNYLNANPGMSTFLNQSDDSIVTPPFKGMRNAMTVYQKALSDIIAGKKTVEQALTDSAKQAQPFLKK